MKSEKPRMIGYFTAWGAADKGYTPARVPVEKLTHLNYAFAAIHPQSQQCILGDPQADLQRLFSDGESVDGKTDDSGAAVKRYLKAGVPPEKLVLGVPFYGRGWEGVPGRTRAYSNPLEDRPKASPNPGCSITLRSQKPICQPLFAISILKQKCHGYTSLPPGFL